MSEQNPTGAGLRSIASGTRRVAVAAALVGTALLGVTACSGGSTTAAGGTTTTTTRQESTTTADAPATTKADKGTATGSVKLPDDLPAGVVLPEGGLIEVSGAAGARVLVFKGDQDVAESYHSTLTGKGYMVVGTPTAFTATKGTSSIVVAAGGDTVTVTVAGV